jgi:hypothetical protein
MASLLHIAVSVGLCTVRRTPISSITQLYHNTSYLYCESVMTCRLFWKWRMRVGWANPLASHSHMAAAASAAVGLLVTYLECGVTATLLHNAVAMVTIHNGDVLACCYGKCLLNRNRHACRNTLGVMD